MLIQFAVVALAVALWVWLLADGAARLLFDQPALVINRRRLLIAAPCIVAASIAFVHYQSLVTPDTTRIPQPCGPGIDYDTRDGRCYARVPLKYQRQQVDPNPAESGRITKGSQRNRAPG